MGILRIQPKFLLMYQRLTKMKKEKGKKGKKEKVCVGEEMHFTFYNQSFPPCSIKRSVCQIREVVQQAVQHYMVPFVILGMQV